MTVPTDSFPFEPRAVPRVESAYRRIVTPLPVPESIPLLRSMARYEPPSMLGQPPLVWDRAAGIQVFDPYGNVWLDWSSGVLVANVGHSHPKVTAAAIAEIEHGRVFSYCFPTEPRIRLAQRLVELAPEGLDRAFLLSTGSETVENVIKLARTRGQAVGGADKTVIVTFDRGFHGRTLGSQLAGGFPDAKRWIGHVDPNFVQVPFPDGFRCTDTDFALFERSLAEWGVAPGRVAGVIMESYQGGGASFAPEAYVRALRGWCDENDAVLVFDEVQAGFGRTGRMFGFEHYGVVPDAICLGKAISGSFPVAAVVAGAGLLDQFGPGSMTSTHGGNPVGCAASLANLEVLEREGLVEHAAAVGARLGEGLQSLAARYPGRVGAVHGRGLVYGLHVVRDGSIEPDPALAGDIVRRCFESGLLMFAPVGYGGATVKVCPPLTIPADAVDEGLSVLADAFAAALPSAPAEPVHA